MTLAIRVSDIMTQNPVSIDPDFLVRDALGLMIVKDLRHLPVVENFRLIGIISDRDIRDCSYPLKAEDSVSFTDSGLALNMKVSEIMATSIISVLPDSEIEDLIETMLSNKLSAVPVVQGSPERLVGIVSYLDILAVIKDRYLS